MDKIKDGDEVYMETVNGSEPVTIINTPRGEGDLWQIKNMSGEIIALNPYHKDFKCFKKEA